MFLLLLSLAILAVVVLLVLLVVKCDGALRDVSSGALLGAWLTLLAAHNAALLLLVRQVEVEVVGRALQVAALRA